MITLYSFGPNFGLVDPSPFVLKVAAWMKFAEIDFDWSADLNHLRRAPKGKLPFIDDNGEVWADSWFIIRHLQRKYDDPLDAWLSYEQRAISSLVIKSLDENFYWTIIHSRWIKDDTWPTIRETFFGGMPLPLRQIVPWVARRATRTAFNKQGMGRHSDAEILEIAKDTLRSLSLLLGDKSWLFSDRPCTLDATVFAFVAQVTLVELDNELTRLGRQYDNLVQYCRRINDEHFGAVQIGTV